MDGNIAKCTIYTYRILQFLSDGRIDESDECKSPVRRRNENVRNLDRGEDREKFLFILNSHLVMM